MSRVERSWAREAARDQDESAFTPILRRLLYRGTGVISVSFVDFQGECVDYCSQLDPFESKIVGAQMKVTMSEVADHMRTAGGGEGYLLTVHGQKRDLVCRRVGDDYLLVVVLVPRALTTRVMGGIEYAVTELRREAGIGVPHWDTVYDSVRVEVRQAVGWPYAPAAYFDERDARVAITDVMGRWTEGAGRESRLCFRVRTDNGEELTLVHDRGVDRWERQREPTQTLIPGS